MHHKVRHLALAATLVLAGEASAGQCSPWTNPGVDRNTQWPELSVLNYNAPQSRALHDLIKERAYVELASVKHGRLTGDSTGLEYAVSDMHYGAGKHCSGPVDLPAGAEGQFGFVYESAGMIVWVPFACNNVSILTVVRQYGGLPPPPGDYYGYDYLEGGGGLLTAGGAPSAGHWGTAGVVTGYAATPLPYSNIIYGGGYVGGGSTNVSYCEYCTVCPVAPIPEVSPWLMLIVGLSAVAFWHRKGTK